LEEGDEDDGLKIELDMNNDQAPDNQDENAIKEKDLDVEI